mmetsp:Transcript_68062/g.161359  ORF Transcript_68062/g.161359 Transcript_68062/m.161359 type:complete len:286 (+) Transcript_68062:23-880(+)
MARIRIFHAAAVAIVLLASSSEALVSSATFLFTMPRAAMAGNIAGPAPSCPVPREGALRRSLRGGAAAATAGMTTEFALKTVAPACGVLIANLMFLAPMQQVLKARKEGTLGDVNVLPYPAQMGNCGAWLTYALAIGNPWVIAPNVSGLLFGLFYTITGLQLGSEEKKSQLRKSLAVYSAVVFGAIALGLSGATKSVMSAPNLYGWVGNALLMVYYITPLASLANIIKTKNASTIDPRLAFAGVLNGLFWFAYGVAIWDGYVAIPNGIGALIATFSSTLWLAFRK